jgi:hypothetical protein
MNKPHTFCFAPWVHTYLSPQTERRMCCASREPAQNFQQYIDTSAGSGKYIPITLDEHWNGDHMRSVRKRMLSGETLPECEVCNDKLLNVSVYRDYFTHLFGYLWDEVLSSTDEDGSTTMKTRSWDYRFNNLCNFKCRTCGDMLSSSWESEQRVHGMIDWNNPKNNWMRPEIKSQIEQFQTTQVEQEFSQAVEEHRVEEIYWVGGEPLMYEQHWRYMKRIVELGDGQELYARYNTNLSRIYYNGVDLYEDILKHVRDWQICASLDGTGAIGEYIRTGLDYPQWIANYRRGLEIRKHSQQMRIDFTLTLPGMFEIGNIIQLARELESNILAKVIFSFSPDIIMSPLALPRSILEPWINDLLRAADGNRPMTELLEQLKTRPTFQEQWPDDYTSALRRGKQRILKLEEIRPNALNMDTILSARSDVYSWWQNI